MPNKRSVCLTFCLLLFDLVLNKGMSHMQIPFRMDLFLLIAEEPKGLGWLLLQIVPLLVCHWYGCASFSFPKLGQPFSLPLGMW